MSLLDVVTLDGPAGAGKSTVAREVARRLGYRYLDTGAMYRAVTLLALREGTAPDDEVGLERLLAGLSMEFRPDGHLWVNGEDLTREIRSREVTASVSEYASSHAVRLAMSRLQRAMGEGGRLVCEGRDMGSVVFPDARLRIYLDASPEIRARRRQKELEETGQTVDFEELLREIRERDTKDASREEAPLQRVEGQILLDTSTLSKEEVIDQITRLAQTAPDQAR
ncbi:MAG TPA: (d)CMP kinase [Planctomycetes bacterium]|nr:(d)CMP kinase [Planctomycetota bacterium]